jgi:ubiquinone/menaquinone biosynthesis C-methylase UbiE
MDVRDIKYPDATFDLAIDKSTIDALLCGERSFVNVALMLKEVQRVLKEGGVYMIISYGQPENRVFHLEREFLSFEINIYTIKKDYSVDENSENSEKVDLFNFRFIMFMFVKRNLALI